MIGLRPTYIGTSDTFEARVRLFARLEALPADTSIGYATVAGGMSGLDGLVCHWAPARVVVFDRDPRGLENARFMIELISISPNMNAFTSRLFARSVEKWRDETGCDLTPLDADEYMAGAIDTQLVVDTCRRLSPRGRRYYRDFVLPAVTPDSGFEPRLVPCAWTEFLGRKMGTMHYRQTGWLYDDARYTRLKERLSTIPVSFLQCELEEPAPLLDALAELTRAVVFISNADEDEFFSGGHERVVARFRECHASRDASPTLLVASTTQATWIPAT